MQGPSRARRSQRKREGREGWGENLGNERREEGKKLGGRGEGTGKKKVFYKSNPIIFSYYLSQFKKLRTDFGIITVYCLIFFFLFNHSLLPVALPSAPS